MACLDCSYRQYLSSVAGIHRGGSCRFYTSSYCFYTHFLMFDHDYFADDDEDERVTMPVNEEGVKDVHNDVMKVEEFFSELNIR